MPGRKNSEQTNWSVCWLFLRVGRWGKEGWGRFSVPFGGIPHSCQFLAAQNRV